MGNGVGDCNCLVFVTGVLNRAEDYTCDITVGVHFTEDTVDIVKCCATVFYVEVRNIGTAGKQCVEGCELETAFSGHHFICFFKTSGECNGSESRTILEEFLVQLQACLATFCKGSCYEFATTQECIVTDFGNGCGNSNSGELAIAKCVRANVGEAFGKSNCIEHVVVECIITDCFERCICGNVHRSDALCVVESTVANGLNSLRQSYCGNCCTAFKYTNGVLRSAELEVSSAAFNKGNFCQLCTVTESTFSNSSNRCGNGKCCNVGLSKCISTNGSNGFGDCDIGKSSQIECFFVNACQSGGKCYCCKDTAFFKCGCTNNNVSTFEYEGSETDAVLECHFADFSNSCGNYECCDRGVSLECSSTDLGNCCGQSCKVNNLCLRTVNNSGYVLVVKNTVNRGECGVICIYNDFRNVVAACKYRTVECGNCRGKTNGADLLASLEYEGTECNVSTFSKAYLADVGTLSVCFVANCSSGLLDNYFRNCRTTVECISTDGGDVCVFGNLRSGQFGVVCKCIVTNNQCAVVHGGATVDYKSGQGVAACKCIFTNGKGFKFATVNGNRSEVGDVCKCIFTNGGNPRGDRNGCYTCAVCKCAITDCGYAYGNNNIALPRGRNVKDGILCAVGEHTVSGRTEVCTAIVYKYGGEGRNSVECRNRNACKSCGELDYFEKGSVNECAVINGERLNTVVNKFDLFQVCAIIECLVCNSGNTVRDDNLFEVDVPVESFRTNSIYIFGDNEGSLFQTRNEFEINSTHIVLNESTVVRGVDRIDSAFDFTNLNVFETASFLECAYTNNLNGIGDRNAAHREVLVECILKNYGNGFALVGLRNNYVANNINCRTCLNAPSAVFQFLESENVFREHGVDSGICSDCPVNDGSTAVIGQLNTGAVGAGVPTDKCTCVTRRSCKLECGIIYNIIGGAVYNFSNGFINGVNYLIGICLPVSVENYISGIFKNAIGNQLAVYVSGVVPVVEGVTNTSSLGGKSNIIACCKVNFVNAGTHTGIKDDCVNVYFDFFPFGSVATVAYKTYSNLNLATFVEGDGSGSSINSECFVGANLNFELTAEAEDSRPRENTLVVIEGSTKYTVVNGDAVTCYRERSAICGNNADVQNIACNSRERNLAEVEGVGGYRIRNIVDVNDVGNVFTRNCVPAESISSNGEIAGRSKCNLVVGVRNCFGRNIILSVCLNGNGDFAVAESLEAGGTILGGGREGETARCNFNGVVSCVFYGVPREDVITYRNTGNNVKLTQVCKGLTYGICITVCSCSNGEGDTGFNHITTCKVVNSGVADVESIMLVIGVATNDIENVLFCIGNCVECEERIFYNSESVYTIKSLSCEVSYSCYGGFTADVSAYFNLVFACSSETVSDRGTGYVFFEYNDAVGVGDLNGVVNSAVNNVPGNAIYSYVNNGSLVAIDDPKSVQSSISSEDHIFGVQSGELFSVIAHTGPPTAKGKAVLLRSGGDVELTTDSGHIFYVSAYEGNSVFGSALNCICPSSIEGSVSSNRSGVKCKRCLVRFIGIPTDKYAVSLFGIRRSVEILAVGNGHCINCGTAISRECYGIVYLAEKTGLRVIVGERNNAVSEVTVGSAIGCVGKGEGECTVCGNGIRTGLVFSVKEIKLVTTVELQRVLGTVVVIVVKAGFGSFGNRLRLLLGGGFLGVGLKCVRAAGHCKHDCQQSGKDC